MVGVESWAGAGNKVEAAAGGEAAGRGPAQVDCGVNAGPGASGEEEVQLD